MKLAEIYKEYMHHMNKILLALVILLALILVFLLVLQTSVQPAYHAVYLKTGDLYFGQLTRFPFFGLKNVYLLQVNRDGGDNPVSVQRFAQVFWGPEDYIKINRSEVVWTTKLRKDGQLATLLKTNPTLQVQGESFSSPLESQDRPGAQTESKSDLEQKPKQGEKTKP